MPSFKTIYLALGTNLGDRPANLEAALAALPPAVRVMERSFIYETAPWGITDQPAFLNMAVKGETKLAPRALMARLKHLEKELGRQPSVRYGPRLIDIDILFYDDLMLDSPGLTIPHARLHERAFVLAPLAEIAPDFIHPVLQMSIHDLLEQVDQEGVKLYGKDT